MKIFQIFRFKKVDQIKPFESLRKRVKLSPLNGKKICYRGGGEMYISGTGEFILKVRIETRVQNTAYGASAP